MGNINAAARPRARNRIKRFLTSKLVVLLALLTVGLGLFAGGKQVKADQGMATAYQYYLLWDNAGGVQGAKHSNEGKVAQKLSSAVQGTLGSGGNHLKFGYSDLVNSVPSNMRPGARQFCTEMATLTGYHYITYVNNGIASVLMTAGRWIIGLILVLLGVILDLTSELFKGIISFFAKINIMTVLAGYFSNSSLGRELGEAIGLGPDAIRSIVSFGLSVFAIVFVISVVWTLRRGATELDTHAAQKTKTRLIALIGMPFVVMCTALLLQDIGNLQGISAATSPQYSNWLMDSETWAEKYNWDMQVGDVKIANMQGSGNTFVDQSYCPYGAKGSVQPQNTIIGPALWKISTSGSKNIFANTTLALEYMTGDTYNGKKYLAYLEDHDIPNALKGFKASDSMGKVKGAPGGYNRLYDVDNSFYADGSLAAKDNSWVGGDSGSGASSDEKSASSNGDGTKDSSKDKSKDKSKDSSQDTDSNNESSNSSSNSQSGKSYGPYGMDINEFYKKMGSNKTYFATPEQAWIARYMYGAKTGGDLKTYYNNVVPSWEQVTMKTGVGNNDNRISDESMYLALNTQFDAQGGSFSLNTPARGIYAAIPVFDTQTVNYYSVSMVGTPIFTVPAMLSNALVSFIVVMAAFMALWEDGIVDMNVRPFRAWLKSVFLGQIEALEAFAIYAVGLFGTLLLLTILPGALISGLTYFFSKVLTFAIGVSGSVTSGVQVIASSEATGVANWATFIVVAIGVWMLFKNKAFREKLVAALTLPWKWASEKGQALEDMGDGNVKRIMDDTVKERQQRHNASAASAARRASGDTGLNRWADAHMNDDSTLMSGLARAAKGISNADAGLAKRELAGRIKNGELLPDEADPGKTKQETALEQLGNLGRDDRAREDLAKLADEDGMDAALTQALADAAAENGLFNEDGTINTDQLPEDLQDEADDLNARQMALNDAMARDDLTPEEQAQLAQEQADLDRDKALLAGKADGIITKDGLINVDDPRIKEDPALMGRANELNKRQEKLNQRRKEIHNLPTAEQAAAKAELAADQQALDDEKLALTAEADGMLAPDGQTLRTDKMDAALQGDAAEINAEQDTINRDRKQLLTRKSQVKTLTGAAKEAEMAQIKRDADKLRVRQERLDAKRQGLINKSQAIGHSMTAQMQQQKRAELKQLADNVRATGAAYIKHKTPQTVQAYANALQDFKSATTAAGVDAQKAFKLDIDRALHDVNHTKILAKDASGQTITISEDTMGGESIQMQNNAASPAMHSKYASSGIHRATSVGFDARRAQQYQRAINAQLKRGTSQSRADAMRNLQRLNTYVNQVPSNQRNTTAYRQTQNYLYEAKQKLGGQTHRSHRLGRRK